jgi:CMP-N,N'-diacetyllegionaminic acid synthase
VVWELNGAIYIRNIPKFKLKGIQNLKKAKYVMDKWSSIDIDDLIDFKLAEVLLKISDEEKNSKP